ncbi:MAG: type IV pilin-like G/H family protein [Trichodesmium sp. ALOHA_ZT_67]|nr:type IV pilin-like G/H family protein [Trichodesmium sp. ALOHA_ZT_67]
MGIVSAIVLPSFLNQANKAKQNEAKEYIASMNRGQQAYYTKKAEFSDNISALGLEFNSETENYSYDISKVDDGDYVISTATAKNKQLKSYSGIVYVDDNTTTLMICETDKPSLTAPENFESFDICPPGSSKFIKD